MNRVRGLSFEPESHVYAYRGQRVLSVTQHLEAAGLSTLDDIPPAVREFALRRGRLVHEACALYDEGRLNLAALDPILAPYVQAWISFTYRVDAVTEAVEEVVLGPGARWAGTLDWRGSILGYERVLLDRKCGQATESARWQLSGYQMPVEAMTGQRWLRGVVVLRPDGRSRLVPYPRGGWDDPAAVEAEDAHDRGVFLAAVCVNEARQRHLGRTGLERIEGGRDDGD